MNERVQEFGQLAGKGSKAPTRPGISKGVVALHQRLGVEVQPLSLPDAPRRYREEVVQVGPLKGRVRLRKGGYRNIIRWMQGVSVLFIRTGHPRDLPLVFLPWNTWRTLLESGALDALSRRERGREDNGAEELGF